MHTRQTTTKKDIKQALTLLLAEKNLEDISISQLTKKAGINRSTFYLHYLDKTDLLEQLKEETLAQTHQLLEQSRSQPRVALVQILSLLYQDLPFFAEIARHGQFSFRESIADFILEIIHDQPEARRLIRETYALPEKFALEFFTAGLVGVITKWISEGGRESPEELTDLLLATPGFQWWST